MRVRHHLALNGVLKLKLRFGEVVHRLQIQPDLRAVTQKVSGVIPRLPWVISPIRVAGDCSRRVLLGTKWPDASLATCTGADPCKGLLELSVLQALRQGWRLLWGMQAKGAFHHPICPKTIGPYCGCRSTTIYQQARFVNSCRVPIGHRHR